MPRYLVPPDDLTQYPKRHPHFFTDVLVIGGGLAGLRTALAVDSRCQVILLCKIELGTNFDKKANGEILLGREGGHRSDPQHKIIC